MAEEEGLLFFRYLNVNRVIILLTLQLIVIINCILVEEQLFSDFVQKHARNYTNDAVEYAYRYSVFQNVLPWDPRERLGYFCEILSGKATVLHENGSKITISRMAPKRVPSVSVTTKLEFLKLINEKKNILFGECSSDEERQTKVAAWQSITNKAKAMRICAPHRDYLFIRDHLFSVWKSRSMETLQRIEKLNNAHSHNKSAFYGITPYADMTPEEFLSKVIKHHKKINGIVVEEHGQRKRSIQNTITSQQQPQRFDWRDQKVVSPVKNQGDCGACWAFSTIETIETMYALKTGQLPQLSVQQVIDCATNGNYGCQGGDTCATLVWMNSTKVHIVSEKEYPFKHVTGVCKDKDPPHGVQVEDFTCIDYLNNEMRMVESIATHGPLVVAVDATLWQDYLGGIIKYHCETTHNHAVQIVGYDLTGPVPYYIVRNSWGASFGLNGYLHIAIGKNLCGIAREVATVDVV